MNAAADVVTNRTGRRIRRAKPTTMEMKVRAPRRPTRRALRREKSTTDMLVRMKMLRGKAVSASSEKMKDCWRGERGVGVSKEVSWKVLSE